MHIQLTPRLAEIAALVPEGARLADVGTDHAFLPLSLLLSGKIESAIASDLRTGPLAHARKNAKEYGCLDKISLRLGAGLEEIAAAECDTVTVAGMGGETIAQILRDAPWCKDGRHMLILQPMTMIPALRQFLWSQGFEIQREAICTEGWRTYVILCAVGTGGHTAGVEKPLEACYCSSALLEAPGAAAYLQTLLRRERNALEGMLRGRQIAASRLSSQKQIVQNLEHALEGKL